MITPIQSSPKKYPGRFECAVLVSAKNRVDLNKSIEQQDVMREMSISCPTELDFSYNLKYFLNI